MTKGIEDFLNIPSLEEASAEESTEVAEQPTSTFPTAPVEPPKDQHAIEADEVREKALAAFDEIMDVGRNVEPSRSARMFEVAGQMLKTGLDASNSKADKKLKTTKLKLEAKRLRIDDDTIESLNQGAEIIADRNALLKQLVGESIEVEPNEEE